MKQFIYGIFLVLTLSMCFPGQAITQPQSLRGSTDVTSTDQAPAVLKYKKDKEPIPRTFPHQPPRCRTPLIATRSISPRTSASHAI